jgi:hypothetical protein
MTRLGLPAALALASACAVGPKVTTERRPDGIYHLKCGTTLQRCLDEAESVCDHQRYAVLRAFDVHEYKGDPTARTEFRTSEAFVRCGFGPTWGVETHALREQDLCPAPETSPPVAAPAAPGCTPGASVACVGPGGCKGGQVCLPEGGKLGPCDCGPAAPAP